MVGVSMLKGKRIIITGAGGFIGAYFLEKLKDANEVTAILRRKPEDYWRLGLFEKNYEITIADITEREKIMSLFSKKKPDIVFHFASYGTYPRIQKDREIMINANVLGNVNLIDATLAHSTLSFIVGSSSEYGNVPSPMREDGPTSPTLLYGATKLFTTHYGKIRAEEENKRLINIRPFSVYGPYEEPFRLIPYLLTSAILGRVAKLSSSDNVRDFIFIRDFFDALMVLAESSDHIAPGEIFNVGSGREISVGALVNLIEKEVTGKKLSVEWSKTKTSQKEITHWYADISKLKRMGFTPRYDLKQGLRETMQWISKNISNYEEG